MKITAKTTLYCEGVGVLKAGETGECKNAEAHLKAGSATACEEPETPKQETKEPAKTPKKK